MIVLAGAALSAGLSAQTVGQRQITQQRRIAQGARSGSLTAPEAVRLERQEASLHRQVVRDRVDGGGLTAAERARIQLRENHLSNEIYRLKHNGRTR
jgi:hypothetical protein